MAKGKHKDKKASTTAKSKDTKDEAKQKNKREQREEAKVAVFNPYAAIDNELDASEKRFGLSAMAIDKREPRFSTGLLSVDVILAGGFVGGGWYTSAGGEQSAKSTFVMTVLASIMKQVFMSDEASPIKAALFDYEGSTGSAGEYLENIMRSMGVKTDVERIFGVQDEETGKWLVTPKIRYYQPDTGERFFDYVAKLEKLLPDKVRVGENWYYVYENTKDNQKMLKGFYDTAYFSKHNKFRVPAKDGSIQALIITDSYPCMNPGRSEEKEEGDQSLALQARMFSDGIKRIKGKLRKKRIVILGINQLRKIPMAMYGPTEDEPCGQALQFNCLRKDMVMFTNKGLLPVEDIDRVGVSHILASEGKEEVNHFAYLGHHITSSVLTESGHHIAGRLSHRVLAIKEGDHALDWVKLKNLTTQHYIPIKFGGNVWADNLPNISKFKVFHTKGQGSNNQLHNPKFPAIVTVELAKLCGMLIADGHMGGSHGDSVSFTNSSIDKITEVQRLFKLLFGLELTKVRQKVTENGITVYSIGMYSTEVTAFLRYLGLSNKSSRDKEVPWIICQAPRDIVVAFLTGLFTCDCHSPKGELKFSFSSHSGKVAHIVQLLLLNLGIYATRSLMAEHYKHFKDPVNPTTTGAILSIQGYSMVSKLLEIFNLPKDKTKNLRRMLRRYENATSGERNRFAQEKHLVLPKLYGWRTSGKRFWSWVSERLGTDNILLTDLTKDLISEYKEYVSGMATPQQRDAHVQSLIGAIKFFKYTKANNLVWVRVADITHGSTPTAVYDANMPETQTTVANGVVSHNSDVRFRSSSCALSAVGAKGQSNIEEEESVVTNGFDKYRYIRFHTHKNKMGGIPKQTIFLRLVVENAKGDATGFCRTWDCFQYMKLTGQIEGNRKKIKFLPGFSYSDSDGKRKEVDFKSPFAGKVISWMDFKALVEADKATVAKLCKAMKMPKPVMLRSFLEKQVHSGQGYSYLKANKRAQNQAEKAKGGAVSDDDDD